MESAVEEGIGYIKSNFDLMKRITALFSALIVIAAMLMPSGAEARRFSGEKTLGMMGGFASYNSGGYMDLYFHYTFSPHVRIAPEIGYVFSNNGKSAFEMSVDMHFPFRVARGFQVYPLAGLTFNNWNYKHAGSKSRVGADFGFGFELYLTTYLKLNLQGKYSLMSDTDGAFIGLGIGYNF